MKKAISIILSLCMVIAIGSMATGCGNDEVIKRIDNLHAELGELKTQNTQLNEKLEEMQTVIDGQNKAIEILNFRTAQGKFYTLQESYDNGWVTQNELKSIAYYHNRGREQNEKIMSENYVPLPKTPEVLSEEVELKIKFTTAKYYNETHGIEQSAKNFRIVGYWGTYGDSISVTVRDSSGSAGQARPWNVSIAGVIFFGYTDERIQVWRLI